MHDLGRTAHINMRGFRSTFSWGWKKIYMSKNPHVWDGVALPVQPKRWYFFFVFFTPGRRWVGTYPKTQQRVSLHYYQASARFKLLCMMPRCTDTPAHERARATPTWLGRQRALHHVRRDMQASPSPQNGLLSSSPRSSQAHATLHNLPHSLAYTLLRSSVRLRSPVLLPDTNWLLPLQLLAGLERSTDIGYLQRR